MSHPEVVCLMQLNVSIGRLCGECFQKQEDKTQKYKERARQNLSLSMFQKSFEYIKKKRSVGINFQLEPQC